MYTTDTTTQEALTEKALLVSLKIAQWSARKFDKKATQEVNDNHGATDAGRFNKTLVNKDFLKEIGKVANEARTFHYSNTLPWGENGERLLPTANYLTYCHALSKFKSQFNGLVREFTREYPAMIDEARRRLNGLFSASDYPANVADRFNMEESFMPVPATEDFRLNLNNQETEKLRARIGREVENRFREATADIYKRIAEQLTHMHERLSQPADKDGKYPIFRDSLFENLSELVDLLPRLNITDDENIKALAEQLKAVQADPAAVRDNSRIRAEKAAQVEDILHGMKGFFGA